jgi:hypothetical protein
VISALSAGSGSGAPRGRRCNGQNGDIHKVRSRRRRLALRFEPTGAESAMNFGKHLPLVLLASALGCGGRSALDAFGTRPASSGEDATVGGPVEGGPSSSGGSSGSGSASGSGSGSSASSSGSGSPEAGSCNCPGGCCDVYSICRPGTVDTACGQTGSGCTDCTVDGTTCADGLCLVPGGSSSSGSSGRARPAPAARALSERRPARRRGPVSVASARCVCRAPAPTADRAAAPARVRTPEGMPAPSLRAVRQAARG